MTQLHHQVWIDAPADRVYAAISEADRLAAWWDSHTETRQGPDLIWEHAFSRGGALQMKVVARVPDQRVVLECIGAPQDGTVDEEWLGTTLTFALSDRSARPHTNAGWMGEMRGQTILDFTHAGWRAGAHYAALCNATWGMVLMGLKGQCEAARPERP